MNTRISKHLLIVAILSVAPCSMVLAQDNSGMLSPSQENQTRLIKEENNWYFSWGYSRQQYAPSDIHVTQASQGSNFTVHQAKASDFHTNIPETIDSLLKFNFFAPQENIRVGKFMNPEKTFAIEFSLDHSKYNTDLGQTAYVSGTINNQPANKNMVLDQSTFDYKLHNGLNHVMLNAVWLHHLYGPEQKPGDLQSISRIGGGFLLPHADNTISGNANQVGPKWENSCCFASNDWWQLLGWTVGVELGLRFRMTESTYLEGTVKEAYGVLRRVPVYQGTAEQTIWMTEEVLSVGYLF